MFRYPVALLALALAFFTGSKLFAMAQIKGWVPGASVKNEVITQKWHQEPAQPSDDGTFWVAWGDTSIKERGNHRMNLAREKFDAVEVGSPLEVVRVPGRDHP